MFLHVSVILYTGGVSGEPPRDQGEPPRTRQTPPRDQGEPPLGRTRQTPPPDQGEPPRDQGDPPRTKENPPPQTRQTPPDQADPPHPPGTKENPPPGPRRTPPGKKTAAYGQWAAGTHLTGMHSCSYIFADNNQLYGTMPKWNFHDICQQTSFGLTVLDYLHVGIATLLYIHYTERGNLCLINFWWLFTIK